MVHTQMSAVLPDFTGFTITHGPFHLRLTEKRGSGAYGVVYVAEDISFKPHGARFYAVKCLLRHSGESELAHQQYREFANHRLVSDIPNVVSLHAVIEEDFYTFLVLDLCEGGDLFNALTDRGTYVHNTQAVKRSFLQIVDALEECHKMGVYHRDLKPENILCSADDSQVYLADFGLSTRSTRSTNFGCGSSYYMSPECLGIYRQKKPYLTGPSDVWALGTILCNLITGRNPWHIASPRSDFGFNLYLREGPVWLYQNLPVSFGAAAILGRIFDLNPQTRITLPQLREAILALDTFYREAAPSETLELATHVDLPEGFRESQEVDITDSVPRPRPANGPGLHHGCWELRPIELSATFSTDFMSMAIEDISAAASATLAGTISSFIDPLPLDEEFDDGWSTAGLPPHSRCSVTSSELGDSESGSESEGPSTPETYASIPAGAVPDLALDTASQVSEEDITLASTRRLADIKHGKSDKKRRGSMSRIVEGMKRIRVLA